ncbi:MAG TPA: bifunctional nuclease family protein [Pyrinomonadaceae bacterium]|nr:bifunctional nuclease family protein [Pyrinomonadaceae bacterium]
MLIEVKVGALIMDPNSNTPIVVLKGVEGETILPIWVGAYEANAIALEIEKMVPQRPMTHDLLRNIIVETGYTVERVIVTDLQDNTFYASIEMVGKNGEKIAMDARPSDAIALALRADCPIFIAQKVLDVSAASNISSESGTEVEESTTPAEEWPDVIG